MTWVAVAYGPVSIRCFLGGVPWLGASLRAPQSGRLPWRRRGQPLTNEGKPEWEFEAKNVQVFSKLATAMRAVALVFLIKGLAVNGVMSMGSYLLHPRPQLIYSDIFGEFAEMFDYVFFGFFLWHAARDIAQIESTTGSDITFLMRGMAALLAFFQRLVIVGTILVLKGLAATAGRLSALSSLSRSGAALPVASPTPFGCALPPWSLPLGFLLITAFMTVVGRKSLRDDYSKIADRMQPPSK